MAMEDDDWSVVAPPSTQPGSSQAVPSRPEAKKKEDDWVEVARPSSGNTSVPMIESSPQYAQDVALVGEPSAKGAAEIAATNAANMALFNIPSHLLTWARRGPEEVTPEERAAMSTVSEPFQKQAGKLAPGAERRFSQMVENVPSIAEEYYKDYATQKEREAALQRQHPYASGAGTVAGFLGGMAVPLGPLAKPGQLAAKGAEALAKGSFSKGTAEAVGRAAEAATTGALVSGTSSLIEEPDVTRALISAGVGTVLGPALSAGANKLIAKWAKDPEPLVNGQWSASAQKAIDEVFGPSIMSGKMDYRDLDLIKNHLAQTFQEKGISAASAREAGLKAAGAEAPTTSQVTGRAPTSGVMLEPEIVQATQKVQDDILARLGKDIPGVPTHPDVAAQELYRAATGAKAAVSKSYEDLSKIPGRFTLGDHAKTLSKNMPTEINAELSRSGYPVGTNLGTVPQYSKALEAYKMVQDTIVAGKMPLGQELTMKNVDEVRKGINNLWTSADKGSADRNAIDAIRRGFDNGLMEAAQAGLFTGNAGTALATLRQSLDLHSKFRRTFSPDGPGENRFIRTAVDAFRDSNGKLNPQGMGPSAQVAQGILNSGLINNTLGAKTYAKLEDALGRGTPAMSSVRDSLRGSILNSGGDVNNLAKNIDRFLEPQNAFLARKLFDPAEMARLRLTSQALKDVIRTPKPDRDLNEQISETLIKNMPAAILKGSFAAIGAFTHGLTGAVVGAALSTGKGISEKLGENVARGRQIKRELSGAPTVSPTSNFASVPKTDLPIAPLFPTEQDSAYGPPRAFDPRIGRKSGGRVSDRLIAEVSRAKKSIDSGTEKLLNVDDERIARALQVANQNLEG